MSRKVDAFFILFVSRITTDSFIGFSKNTLNTVNYFKEIIGFVTNLSLCLFLHYFLINNLKRKIQIIYDVILDDKIKRHILSEFSNLLSNPLVKTTDCIALQIFRFNFSNRQIDVLNRSTFIFLLFLHLFLRDLQSDNEIRALRSKHLINVLEVEILFGSIISLKAEHHSSLFLNSLEHIIKSINCLYDISIPKRFVFAKSFNEFDRFL